MKYYHEEILRNIVNVGYTFRYDDKGRRLGRRRRSRSMEVDNDMPGDVFSVFSTVQVNHMLGNTYVSYQSDLYDFRLNLKFIKETIHLYRKV